MAASKRQHTIKMMWWAAMAVAIALTLTSCGSKDVPDGDKPSPSNPAASQPHANTTYPRRVDASASQVLKRLPSDAQAVLLVASLGALVELANDVGRWGFIQADNLASIQKKLDLNYGINPWDLNAWTRAGFDVTGAVGVAKVGGNWVLAVAVHDPSGFERFLDGWINEEFGRPRPRLIEAPGRALKQTLIFARDFATTACEGGYCYVVTGRYFDPTAADSPALLTTLLSQASGIDADTSLARQLQAQGEGMALLFIPGKGLVEQVTAAALRLGMPEGVGADLLAQVRGASVGLVSAAQSAQLRLLIDLPPEALSGLLPVVTPPQAPNPPLASLLPAAPKGLLRLTFDPQALESWLLTLASEDTRAKWAKIKRDKLKRKQGPFTLYDAEQELLYNLTGHVLISLQRLDADALALAADDPELLLSAIDLALYLPLRDAALSDALFSKLDLAKSFILDDKSVKDLLKRNHAALDISTQQGAQVITLSRKGQPVLRVLYKGGTLAILLGAGDPAPTIARLQPTPGSPAPWQPPAASPMAAILDASATWGLSFDAYDIAALLGARFKIIRTQIDFILTPLQRLSLRVRFEPQALGLDLGLELRASPPEAAP
jgi:hypothetical protein